jgi:2-oxoglutarate dehydrogenase E2 component (dihydrolipoamide succinyltransferase)
MRKNTGTVCRETWDQTGLHVIFAKACAQALLEKPDVNAHIDGEDLIYHDYVDISIAISTPNGLVVPLFTM